MMNEWQAKEVMYWKKGELGDSGLFCHADASLATPSINCFFHSFQSLSIWWAGIETKMFLVKQALPSFFGTISTIPDVTIGIPSKAARQTLIDRIVARI
jgi:hypothetical protein